MNKEKLEQMKKEKLEQMKELGRGGISRGLSLLQKANTALATNAAAAVDDTAVANGGGGAAVDGEAATLLAPAAAAGKPSYDDLVALSMKLTRQNKLMKTQFQKMQSRIQELQAREADCAVLSAFVSDVVGVDVVSCTLATPPADGDGGSTMEARQLRERFEIVDALKTKALKTQVAQLQTQLAAKETNMALSMTPMVPPPAAAAGPQYDEIDLLGDAFASPRPATQSSTSAVFDSAPSQTATTNAFSDDLLSFDFPPAPQPSTASVESSTTTAAAVLEKQLDEATEQLHRMETEMKRSASENEELRQKFNDMWQQRTAQVELLTSEKTALETRLSEAQQQVASVQSRIDELHATKDDGASEAEALKTLRRELQDAQALNAQLQHELATIQTAANSDKEVAVRSLEASIAALQAENEQLIKTASASVERPAQSDDDGQPVPVTESTLELQSQLRELEAANAKLQQDLATTIAASDDKRAAESSSSDDLAPILEELERVKLARAEADHLVKSLQDKLAVNDKKLAKALNEVEQNVAVIEALRAEIARLMDDVKRVEGELAASTASCAALETEKNQLEEAKEALEEQLQVLRADNSSNLESVVGELAEAKKQVAEQREYMNGKLEVLVRDLDAARRQSESLEASLAEKEKQNQKMAASQSALTSEVMSLQRQVAAMEQDLQMAAEGLEAHASKAEESELRRKELEEKLANARLQTETLKDQHLNDLELMRGEKEAELERVRDERGQLHKKLNESQAALDGLSLKYSGVQDDLEYERKRTAELEVRLGQLTAEIGNMSIDLAETKKALSDRMALATRLQTENMGFAEKQAEQAARVESALRDAAVSKQVVADMEAKVQDAVAEAQRFQAERDGAVDEMAQLMQEMDDERRHMAEQRDAHEAKYKTAVESEKDAFRRELERVESDSKHKSKLALHAVLEKEAEIERLSKRLADLEEDVRSGDADNRKIFEFAQMQAKREMEARANGARIHELTRELEAAHARVQELQHEQARHGEELTAMMQTQRREGVNMEYLKNVIVQFMSFKPGSSQQMRLVPVITTLLQFSAADMKEIKKANDRRSSWGTWGAEKPDYKAIAGVPGASELTHTRRRTSPPTSLPSSFQSGEFDGTTLPPRASSFTLPTHDEDGHSSTTQSADF